MIYNIQQNEVDDLTKIYRFLHQNPELSFREENTSKLLQEKISALGLNIIKYFGGFGFVGILENGPGKTVMLRADMDALPIKEMTNLEYQSKIESTDMWGNSVNVMHACGHDLHMTVLLGTLTKLVENKNLWSGKLIVLLQPAEEVGKGAKAMIEDGLFDKVAVPDYLVAYHDLPDLEAGEVGYTKGTSWAGCDTLDLIIYGEGGHGAVPQKSKDPIVLAAQIILALQTITSREISPFDKVVLTIGAIKGGTKHNIIPEEVELKISLRTFSDDTRKKVIDSIKRIAENTARAFGIDETKLPVVKGLENYHPPVVNDYRLTEVFAVSSVEQIGNENVKEIEPVTVSEDFEIFRRAHPEIKSAIFWLGINNVSNVELPNELKGKTPPLHSPYLAPDPGIPIITGIKCMTNTIVNLFNNQYQSTVTYKLNI